MSVGADRPTHTNTDTARHTTSCGEHGNGVAYRQGRRDRQRKAAVGTKAGEYQLTHQLVDVNPRLTNQHWSQMWNVKVERCCGVWRICDDRMWATLLRDFATETYPC